MAAEVVPSAVRAGRAEAGAAASCQPSSSSSSCRFWVRSAGWCGVCGVCGAGSSETVAAAAAAKRPGSSWLGAEQRSQR